MRTIALTACGLLWAAAAVAADPPAVTAWARATPGGVDTAAVYLTVKEGAGADVITGVSTPAAAMAMLHESVDDHGVMKMRDLDSVALPAGATLRMQPGGMHVMLMGLAHPLKAGERFPVTVTFKDAAPVTVVVTVARIGASAPAP